LLLSGAADRDVQTWVICALLMRFAGTADRSRAWPERMGSRLAEDGDIREGSGQKQVPAGDAATGRDTPPAAAGQRGLPGVSGARLSTRR
jgi:hypothetical protein